MNLARPVLAAVAIAVASAVWILTARAPFFNLFAGPAVAALLVAAMLFAFPGPRGSAAQVGALLSYTGSYGAVLLATTAGLLPGAFGSARVSWASVAGVHGEGFLGILGLLTGAVLSFLLPRKRRSAG